MKRLLFFLFFPLLMFGAELNVDKQAPNQVKFISDAPLEAFEGVTENIDGYVLWSGDDIADSSEFYFEVDLNSLDTGIGLRNRHMRDDYLETDKFRFASYSGEIIKVETKASDSLHIQAAGTFKLHGVEKPLNLAITVKKTGELYLAEAQFIVALTDYDIKVPKLMFMKVDENMAVFVNINLKIIASKFQNK